MARPRFHDRFRVGVAASRFGPPLDGQILPPLASGLPCAAHPHSARRLPAPVRKWVSEGAEARFLAASIARLLDSGEDWEAASRGGRAAVAAHCGLEAARAGLGELLELLHVAHRTVGTS